MFSWIPVYKLKLSYPYKNGLFFGGGKNYSLLID